jgi:diadenosine tetraphosphate (Ap4A) HIT family hydrolase
MTSIKCEFCDPQTDQAQEIMRGKYIKVLHPRRILTKNQLLIMPIRHVEHVHDLSEQEVKELFELLKKINTNFENKHKMAGYNFFVNNGTQAGQHIPHVHFHFFPRYVDEEISPLEKLNNPEKYNIEKLTEEEIKKNAKNIKINLI